MEQAESNGLTSGPFFWVLDTRQIWPGQKIQDAAQKALKLISPEESEKASKFYFIKDAKMSVASSLLKRLFVARMIEQRGISIPFREIQFTRSGDAKHGKPCWKPPQSVMKEQNILPPELDFNVSHQAGLVPLVGCYSRDAHLGVDVVCVDERNNSRAVDEEGFESFVDIHADVFSQADVRAMKHGSASGSMRTHVARGTEIDENSREGKLRRFFAFWALKEAYVKLRGEALLAPWLKEVEFRSVRVPDPSGQPASQPWGDCVREIQVWFKGVQRKDVEMVLQSFQGNYMIATAIEMGKPKENSSAINPVFKLLDLETIYDYAVSGSPG